MGEFLGIENSALKFVIAFVLVMALIGLTAWLIRQFGAVRPSGSGARNRQPRLAVLDSATVDARRRLVLIRRDNVEHLLLIGGPTDVVVEENIVRAQSAAPPRQMQQQVQHRAPPIEPIEPEYDSSLVPYDEPYEEPVHQAAPPPPPPPPARQAPAPRPVTAAQRPAPMPPQQRQSPPPAPAPSRNAQYDMAQRLEAALRQPAPEHPAPRAPVEPRIPAASATPAPPVRAPEPRVMASTPAPAPAKKAEEPEQKSGADVFASLEEEMASLLKPGGKDPS
jgi:flagellar biogenesis protein FliO